MRWKATWNTESLDLGPLAKPQVTWSSLDHRHTMSMVGSSCHRGALAGWGQGLVESECMWWGGDLVPIKHQAVWLIPALAIRIALLHSERHGRIATAQYFCQGHGVRSVGLGGHTFFWTNHSCLGAGGNELSKDWHLQGYMYTVPVAVPPPHLVLAASKSTAAASKQGPYPAARRLKPPWLNQRAVWLNCRPGACSGLPGAVQPNYRLILMR